VRVVYFVRPHRRPALLCRWTSLAIYTFFLPLQILCLFDAVDTLDCEKVVSYIVGLQRPDGSFSGDKWGEVDTRFSMCAAASLALLVGTTIAMYLLRQLFWQQSNSSYTLAGVCSHDRGPTTFSQHQVVPET